MIQRAAKNPEKAEIYKDLVAALHGALPTPIPADDLRRTFNSMRGHMRQLTYAEPWLFRAGRCRPGPPRTQAQGDFGGRGLLQ